MRISAVTVLYGIEQNSRPLGLPVDDRPPVNMDMEIWIWILIMLRGSDAYNIKYFDCSKLSAIYKYETSHLCKESEVTEEPKSHMSVLQRIKNKSLSGHSCQVVRSSWTYYCGAYSHSKIAEIPQIEVTEGLSPITSRKASMEKLSTTS